MNTVQTDQREPLEEIIFAIEKPLAFASKNNFARLHTIKGLDELIPFLADKGLAIASSPENTNIFQKLKISFAAFPILDQAQQEALIMQTLAMLHDMKAASPAGLQSTSFKKSTALLYTPISHIKGVGAKTADAFSRMNIHTIEDMLYCIPRTYIDRRKVVRIVNLQPGMQALVIGTVVQTGTSTLSGRKKIFDLLISDGSGMVSAKWFHLNMTYLTTLQRTFTKGQKVILSGQVSQFRFRHEMHHPAIELFSDEDDIEGKLMIVPVYPLTEGIHQKTVQKIARTVAEQYAPVLTDYIPESIKKQYGLVSLSEAFKSVHVPDTDADIDRLAQYTSPYHRRIVFDEFFLLQLMLALKKRGVAIEPGISFSVPEDKLARLLGDLPFTLTAAQQKTLTDILGDMQKPSPMNRLIQGDVGSGKTVVGLIASLIALWNGYQSAIMAPTEILAEQHYKTISGLTQRLNITTVLLTGSRTKSVRDETLTVIREGRAHLVIGTHALIQETVEFKKLGLVIIDEQHKFGVMQRAEIKKKGENPDVLVMTATPIPRTLGLTVYGDLDISIINELPPGRKPVLTRVYTENKRKDVYGIIRRELQKKNQAFIVYPLVEESEKMDLMDATRMAAHLRKDIFPDYRVGLVHGKMTAAEKDAIMKEFQSGDIHILVATTVIEVGIDVPNASLMIIEHAERFGLSQLHQLRGRVGRGTAASMCILLAQYKRSDDARQRLAVMAKTNDGFKIAEEDFNIRGPGEFLGTRQSGMPDFRVAHIGRDIKILVDARQAAFSLIAQDPELQMPEHQFLRQVFMNRWKGRFELAGIG